MEKTNMEAVKKTSKHYKISWKVIDNTILKPLHLSVFKNGVTGIDQYLLSFWDVENLQYPSKKIITIAYLDAEYEAYIAKTNGNTRTRLCFRPKLKHIIRQYCNVKGAYMRITKNDNIRYSMTIEYHSPLHLSTDTIPKKEFMEYFEGRKREIRVINYVRNRKARDMCLDLSGGKCYVCGLDLAETYGDIGKGFLEVHHKTPISQFQEKHPIRLEDLCAVCPNCHRIIHRTKEPIDVEELKCNVQNNKKLTRDQY